MRRVPVDAKSSDWPRKAAKALNELQNAVNWSALKNYADDTAAAAGGVPVGGLYRTGNNIRVRIV